MTERLTDEEIAALVLAEGSPGWTSDAACVDLTFMATGRTLHLWDIVDALAPEVLQTRQRRCENCEHWRQHVNALGPQPRGWCEANSEPGGVFQFVTEADWFCASFTRAV